MGPMVLAGWRGAPSPAAAASPGAGRLAGRSIACCRCLSSGPDRLSAGRAPRQQPGRVNLKLVILLTAVMRVISFVSVRSFWLADKYVRGCVATQGLQQILENFLHCISCIFQRPLWRWALSCASVFRKGALQLLRHVPLRRCGHLLLDVPLQEGCSCVGLGI